MFSRDNKQLISKQEQDSVTACIQKAEQDTSGEIRVYMEPRCPHEDPLQRSEEIFTSLNMHLTKERNGVLIYLATEDRKFAIAGDEGIHTKAGGNDYWEKAAATLRMFLKEGRVSEGLCTCIAEVGATLAKYFPQDLSQDNNNELSDEIVFGA